MNRDDQSLFYGFGGVRLIHFTGILWIILIISACSHQSGNLSPLLNMGVSVARYGGFPSGANPDYEHHDKNNLLTDFRQSGASMDGVDKIVFAVRPSGLDEHWYANFGYYADDSYYGQHNEALTKIQDANVCRMTLNPTTDYRHHSTRTVKYVSGGRSRLFPHVGGKLCIYDIKTQTATVILSDSTGSIRDPQVHYDGRKILFAYCPAGKEHYHLYEIKVDGSGLRQLTDGDCDDIEPAYTPDGDIIFVSSRANRWVQCWNTPVAILYGCDAEGKNIHALSGNVEQDNTPWMLPDGRVLYTRWEYVDRSQVDYHHLWTMNPDGTRQSVFYGNMRPGTVFIDAKPVPGSRKIVASFSPGHGITEHAGFIGLIDPRLGPDDPKAATTVSKQADYRDPWAFSENAFLAAKGAQLILMDGKGEEQILFELPDEWKNRRLLLHEPRPILQRTPEDKVASTVKSDEPNGRLMLMNVYAGRNMEGVKPGEIKKLLILETLPKPINFTGGMEPLTYGGSFTLERIFGTVPVEEDGSAHFELPAIRSFLFVALDENDRAVKRMQSFVSVMPGELTSCIGCHERRTDTPDNTVAHNPLAVRRAPSPITVIADFRGIDGAGNRLEKPTDIPDVIDFPRDVQPVLDAHCIQCHNPEKRRGGVSLVGDRTPLYSISYYTITAKNLVADGRNLPKSNYPPRVLGSGGSRLLDFCDGSHHDAKLSEREQTIVRLWCETGATYPGTYTALGSGMVGGYAQNRLDRQDLQWDEVKKMSEVLTQNCAACHTGKQELPLSPSHEIGGPPWDNMRPDDVRRKFSRQLLYNLTHPEKSTLLLAPLAKSAGGYESCGKAVFKDKNDPRYRKILKGIERTKQHLDQIKRFDMSGFVPRPEYVREMKKYGVLPPDAKPEDIPDIYSLEQQYWQSLW
jgi:mono/diheme cytochrome c family protein